MTKIHPETARQLLQSVSEAGHVGGTAGVGVPGVGSDSV